LFQNFVETYFVPDRENQSMLIT